MLTAALMAAGGIAAIVHAAAGDVVLVSRADGASGAGGSSASVDPAISPDGRYVVFQSSAANLPGANGKSQIYERDVVAGTTTLVSADGTGTAGDNNSSYASVSADGRYVAFLSSATNLSTEDNAYNNVFVRDVVGGTTTLVSRGDGPAGAPTTVSSNAPVISADGTWIAFANNNNLTSDASGVSSKVYVRNRVTQANELVSVDAPSQVGNYPSISADGNFVAFEGQVPNGTGILVRDRTAKSTVIASRADGPDGAPAANAARPSISADGRYVVFKSSAGIVTEDTNGKTDVYERDLVEGWTVLVSRADGATGGIATLASDLAHVSDDGRRVAFVSGSTNLTGLNNGIDVLLRDTLAGTTEMIRGVVGHTPPGGAINGVAMAGAGGFVAYDDTATYSSDETGSVGDVFRRELGAEPAVTPPTVNVADLTLDEGSGGGTTNAIVPVTLSAPAARPVDVTWTTHDGTAVAGTDYTASTGHVRFAVGQTSATVTVPIAADDVQEGDETFTVALSDGLEGTVGRTGTVTIHDDDAAASGGGGGATGGGGSGPGGDTSGTTLVTGPPSTGCDTKLTVGLLRLQGCLSGDASDATSHGVVSVDGLTVTPDDANGAIEFRATGIQSQGKVTVAAGSVVLFHDVWKPRWRDPAGLDSVDLTTDFAAPPATSQIFGLTLGPTMRSVANRDGSIAFDGKIVLPIFGVQTVPLADLHLGVDADHGLLASSLEAKASYVPLVAFDLENVDLHVDPLHGTFGGSGTIILPTPNRLKIGAGMEFDAQGFKSAYGEVQNLNFPIQSGIYLQRIKVAIGVRPLSLGGGLGISAGPLIGPPTNPYAALQVDGNFAFVFSDPAQLHVDGDLKIARIPVASAYFDVYTNGNVDFGAHVGIGLPNVFSSNPAGEPVYAGGDLTGWVQGTKAFNFEAQVQISVLGATVGADLLGSNLGMAGCGKMGFFQGGFGYTWANQQLTVMGPFVCDVGPWRATQASAAQAGGARTLRFAADDQLIALTGDGAPPSVVLRGPGGQALQTPSTSQPAVVNQRFVVLQDPRTNTTYVAIHHAKGSWTMTPAPGSVAVIGLKGAGILPPAKVTGKVSGTGRGKRTLRYRLSGTAGQKVTFAEIGRQSHQVIGVAHGRSGTLRFTPAEGKGGRRRIVALVTRQGTPRTQLTVATFVAPGPPRLGKPTGVKAKLVHGTVVVTWRPVGGADRYIVAGKDAKGGPLQAFVLAPRHRATVTDVVPITAARLTVRAVSRAGRAGPAAKLTVRAPHARRP